MKRIRDSPIVLSGSRLSNFQPIIQSFCPLHIKPSIVIPAEPSVDALSDRDRFTRIDM